MQTPKFKLQKVYANGASEKPELHELHSLDLNCRMGRRGFLLTSALGAGAVAALTGCVAGLNATDSGPIESIKFSETDITPQFVKGVKAHRSEIKQMAFSPNGKLLISISAHTNSYSNTSFTIWSMPGGKAMHTVNAKKKLYSFAFSPDGNKLYLGLIDGIAVLDAPFTGSPKYLVNTEKEVDYVAVSPNGNFLAATVNGLAQIRSLPSGKILHQSGRAFKRLAFTANNAMLVACGDASETAVINVETGKELHNFPGMTMAAQPIPNSQNLAIGVKDTLQIWPLTGGKRISARTISKNRSRGDICVSPNGKWLVCATIGANKNRAVIFNPPFTKAGAFLALPEYGNITALAISSNSKAIATGDSNGNIYIWQISEDGKNVAPQATLFNPAVMDKNTEVSHGKNEQGSTYVGRCGDPIPAGAVCTCNCVPGAYTPPAPAPCACNTVPVGGSSGGGGYYCTCNKICTCVPVK